MIDGVLTKPEPTKEGLTITIKAALEDFAKVVPMFMQPVRILTESEYRRLTGEGTATVQPPALTILSNLLTEHDRQREAIVEAMESVTAQTINGEREEVKV